MANPGLLIAIARFVLACLVCVSCGSSQLDLDTNAGLSSSSGLNSIQISPASTAIAAGTQQSFTAMGLFADGSVLDLSSRLHWSSSDSSTVVMTLERASALKEGSATITARDRMSGITDSVTLLVSAAILESVSVSPTLPQFALGSSFQAVGMGLFSDDTTQDLTSELLWSSSDPQVASVLAGAVQCDRIGSTTITATDAASGLAGTLLLSVTPAVLTSISVTPSTSSIAQGTSLDFFATGIFSDNTTQDLTASVQWDSSDELVAMVSNAGGTEGRVDAVLQGTTTIRATHLASGLSATSALSVIAVALESLSIGPATSSIALGTSLSLSATGTFNDSSIQDLSASVVWSSSDLGVAQVSNISGTQGLLLGVGIGSVTITALDLASGVIGTKALDITPAVLVSISLSLSSSSIALGTNLQPNATGTFSDGSTQDLTQALTWNSSDAGVATVSNASGSIGLCTSVSVGSTTLRATDPNTGLEGSALLSVTPAALVSIGLTPSVATLALGTAQTFTAIGTYSDSTTQDLSLQVTWTSSNPAVASISNVSGSEGLATSLTLGATQIVATDAASGVSASVSLTVTAAVLVALGVTPANPSIALGTGQAFIAMGVFSDSSVQDLSAEVTWTSSDALVASVSNALGFEGQASGLSIGDTTISAMEPGSGLSAMAQLTISAAELVSIAVTPAAPSIPLGLSLQFSAMGTYTDSTLQDLTGSVTWSSSVPAVASVSNGSGTEGLATSLGLGNTSIKATDVGSGLEASVSLGVSPAQLVSIAVTPSAPSIALGTTQQFVATGSYSDSSTQVLTDSVTWSSSDALGATISNAPGSEGLCSSVSTGSLTLFATDPASALVGSASLTITPAVLLSLALTPNSASAPLGTDLQLTATGTYSDATTQDLTSMVTWSSASPGFATVSNAMGSEGLVTSLAVGSSLISAVEPGSGVSGSTNFEVTLALLVSIQVTPSDTTLLLGAGLQYTAMGSYTDASSLDLTNSVTWSSTSPGVATISNAPGSQGLLTGLALGTTQVTALDASSAVSGAATLEVVQDIGLRSTSSGGEDSGILSLNLATPAGTVSGDLMLASIAVRPSSAVITAPAGWTLIRRTDNASGVSNSLASYRKIATANEPGSHAWGFSSSTGSAGGIVSFYGVDATAPVDVHDGQNTVLGLNHVAPGVTTSVDACMLVTAHAFASSQTWSPPNAMTEAIDVASLVVLGPLGTSLSVHYALQTSSGATGAKVAKAEADADVGNTHSIALAPLP